MFTSVTEIMVGPGATTSGFTYPSYHVGPRELYDGTSSSPCETVPFVSTAPTVLADGALPAEVPPAYPISPVSGLTPTLPAETTTTMPDWTACSTACTSGSFAAAVR